MESSGFSSTLSLAKDTRPSSSPASCSRTGAIIRHGPHHSAQKSTTTGSAEPSTRFSKSFVDTWNGVVMSFPASRFSRGWMWLTGEVLPKWLSKQVQQDSKIIGSPGLSIDLDFGRPGVPAARFNRFEPQPPARKVRIEIVDLVCVRQIEGTDFLPLIGDDPEREDLGRAAHRPRPEADSSDLGLGRELDLDPGFIPLSVRGPLGRRITVDGSFCRKGVVSALPSILTAHPADARACRRGSEVWGPGGATGRLCSEGVLFAPLQRAVGAHPLQTPVIHR